MTNRIIFIMGVSGSGKSTIGGLLAKEIMLPLFDADDFHPTENVAKMQQGIPLNDLDRAPWLDNLNELAIKKAASTGAIITCSALKAKYRDRLVKGLQDQPKWIFLNGDFDILFKRINSRVGHFMPASLLHSQLNTLEIPENAISINIEKKPREIVEKILTKL